MKHLLFLFAFLPGLLNAQVITGKWNGLLRAQGMELRLVFHISQKDSVFEATLDSPDQKAFGIVASAVSFKSSILTIEIAKAGVRYQGQYGPDGIDGTFKQSGQSYPLKLVRKEIEKKALFRPQEPRAPFPYVSEEVRISSEEGKVILAGSLTMPDGQGNFPAAILISGSGPQNRDEEFMTHKPFLVLADHLTRNGIAVLRYDDRGFAQSTGNHGNATSADLANDVRAAIAYLRTRKEIDTSKIGLIGHSEGGLIAPIVGVDSPVAFMVLLAAPGQPGGEILLKQVEQISRLRGANEQRIRRDLEFQRGVYDLFKQFGEDKTFEARLDEYLKNSLGDDMVPLGMTREEIQKLQKSQFKSPWLRYFLKYDPVTSLNRLQCPVLALNGEKDIQVAPENLAFIEKAIRQGGNQKITTMEFKQMNHLFQTCTTGAMEEYATIDQTIDPVVLNKISDWVVSQTR